MQPPTSVHPLTDDERAQVEAGLGSPDAFMLWRCQILLASARRARAPAIAPHPGYDDQTVCEAMAAGRAGA